VASFVREEAEDMWAEAKSIRQKRLQQDGAETEATNEGADTSEHEAEEEHEAKPEHPTETDSDTQPQGDGAPEATPAARRHAEEWGVDLQEVEGTGARGHITLEDVEKKAESEG
jgi:pyruvate/2-oxoglutarate dehydrogenase complex dihydrolipoamide acyltransferase (E2) component